MANDRPASVDEYLERFEPRVRDVLQRMRRVLQRALPGAEEVISYSLPAYRLGGRVVIYFAGWKEHTAIYPATGSVRQVFRRELSPFEVTKGAIRFPLGQRLPTNLIAGIAKLRAAETAKLTSAKRPAGRDTRKHSPVSGRPAARRARPAGRPRPVRG